MDDVEMRQVLDSGLLAWAREGRAFLERLDYRDVGEEMGSPGNILRKARMITDLARKYPKGHDYLMGEVAVYAEAVELANRIQDAADGEQG